jgi:hypothetical protein
VAAGSLLALCACVVGALYLGSSLDIFSIAGLPIGASPPAPTRELPAEAITERIGSEGGEIAAPGGAKVIVPQEALSEEVEVGIAQVDSTEGAPPDMAPAGPAYDVYIPTDVVCRKPLEVVLPLEREAGTEDDAYAAYRWDGSQWHFLGGIVEGDTIHVQVSHHTFAWIPNPVPRMPSSAAFTNPAQRSPQFMAAFRELSTGRYRTIAFVNQGEFSPWVMAWTWGGVRGTERECRLPAYGGWTTTKPGTGYYPYSWAWLRLPYGTYTSWCVEWWDDDEKAYFHTILDRTVTLDVATCTMYEHETGECEIPRVDYALPTVDMEEGLCGRPPGTAEVSPTATPTPGPGAPTDTPEPSPTPGVKLGEEFRDEVGGFSFRVIPGYKIGEITGFPTMEAPDADPDVGPIIAMMGGIGEREAATVEELYAKFVSGLEKGIDASDPREVTVGGVRGLEGDLSGLTKGKPFTGRIVLVVVSDTQSFSMLGLAPADRWDEFEPYFDAVRDSVRFFTPSADVDLPAPTTTPAASSDAKDVAITLTWWTTDDLNLIVYDPLGTTISYLGPISPQGGQLDKDANNDCASATTSPSETISWPVGSAPYGSYRAAIFLMGACPGTNPVDFRLVVQVDGATILDVEGVVTPLGAVPYYDFTR